MNTYRYRLQFKTMRGDWKYSCSPGYNTLLEAFEIAIKLTVYFKAEDEMLYRVLDTETGAKYYPREDPV